MNITADIIYAIAPSARAEIVNGIVEAAKTLFDKYKISDRKHVAWMLGRIAVETGGFNRLEENLFYTSVKRLRQVWPSRFKSDASAAPYVRNPQKLANLVYGGRLGNVGPNDGWLYRGSGDMQTTGFFNFREVQNASGVPCVEYPDNLRSHPGALIAALVYWTKRNLGRFVDANDIAGLCKAIQGGTLGLADQKLYTDRAMRALDGTVTPRRNTDGWLRRGDSGPAVERLQRRLQVKGYYDGGAVDGIFGEGTEDAVKHFQRQGGLIADGVVGPATSAALEAPVNPSAPDPHKAPADADPVTVPAKPEDAFSIGALLAAIFRAILSLLQRR